jgi:hypothetical protein
MYRELAPLEWLEMSHMSVLGGFWAQVYFDKEVYFGHRPIFEKDLVLGKDLFLERKT